jgi:hypothetical protein
MQSEEKKCSPTWELSETCDLTNANIFAKPRFCATKEQVHSNVAWKQNQNLNFFFKEPDQNWT